MFRERELWSDWRLETGLDGSETGPLLTTRRLSPLSWGGDCHHCTVMRRRLSPFSWGRDWLPDYQGMLWGDIYWLRLTDIVEIRCKTAEVEMTYEVSLSWTLQYPANKYFMFSSIFSRTYFKIYKYFYCKLVIKKFSSGNSTLIQSAFPTEIENNYKSKWEVIVFSMRLSLITIFTPVSNQFFYFPLTSPQMSKTASGPLLPSICS